MKPIMPSPDKKGLTTELTGMDAKGQHVTIPVVTETPLTIYLNRQEIVTAMTLGDQPEALAVGFLLNQNMLLADDKITAIDYDKELGVVIVRTERETDYEARLQKKVQTSGCAQGTVYGDIMDVFETIHLDSELKVKASSLYNLSAKINQIPSLYLKAGAIHGCALAEGNEPLMYLEDIGRHNAVDKLTTEMVLKTVMMGISILVSRSGFTEAGVMLARRANLTLIGRMRGARFTVLSGDERIIFDDIKEQRAEEKRSHQAQRLEGSE